MGLFKKLFEKKAKTVLCISISGVIAASSKVDNNVSFAGLQQLLSSSFSKKKISAVAISINSPGGSPVQSELIYNYIRELSQSNKVPVYTFAQDVAASGGYWLLLSGDEIYAHNSSIVGSIGVLFSSFGFVDLMSKLGVTRRVYTEGEEKSLLDPFLPEDTRGIELIKSAQRDVFEEFKSVVKFRRGEKITKEDSEIFTGAFWSGKKALELGLIDGICDMRKKMKEKFGEGVKLVYVSPPKKSLLKTLLFKEKHGSSIDDICENIIGIAEEKLSFLKYGIKK